MKPALSPLRNPARRGLGQPRFLVPAWATVIVLAAINAAGIGGVPSKSLTREMELTQVVEGSSWQLPNQCSKSSGRKRCLVR